MGRKIVWAVVLYFALALVPAVAVKLFSGVTAGQLAGPYLAYAAPGAIFLPLASWLRRWEDRGAAPRRVALAWGLSVGLFALANFVAFFYACSALGVFGPDPALVAFIILAGLPVVSITAYSRAWKTVSRRAILRPSA